MARGGFNPGNQGGRGGNSGRGRPSGRGGRGPNTSAHASIQEGKI